MIRSKSRTSAMAGPVETTHVPRPNASWGQVCSAFQASASLTIRAQVLHRPCAASSRASPSSRERQTVREPRPANCKRYVHMMIAVVGQRPTSSERLPPIEGSLIMRHLVRRLGAKLLLLPHESFERSSRFSAVIRLGTLPHEVSNNGASDLWRCRSSPFKSGGHDQGTGGRPGRK